MEWFNLALVVVVLAGLYTLPKIVERYVSISLGIVALIKGVPEPKKPSNPNDNTMSRK